MRKNTILIIFLLLIVSSCTYHLRYTISTEGRQITDKIFIEKTYAVERKENSITEHELLKILTQSLSFNGWSEVPEDEAEYIFSLLFETEKKKQIDELWLLRALKGSGQSIYRNNVPGRRAYLYHHLEIEANSSRRSYTWSSNIKTGPVLQEIETVARHIIPEVISLFPGEGYWEIKDEVYLHKVK
ncbi:MAG: hypothetical protein JSV25_10505 [Spirochaetota bacterium]|nr:MAG: hypothetical protein JSV25_10505 [Spirochaetota bacterium]